MNRKLIGRVCMVLLLAMPLVSSAQEEPPFSTDFGRDNCTFTSVGQSSYFPLIPGLILKFEGQDLDDENELVDVALEISILDETEVVDGVTTRVYREYELEDGELIEISRNFMAVCRETGDVWYFGEDVDIYEDGEIVAHDGAWRAGVDGAIPGIIMPGSPIIGARYQQELAPGVAEDRGEIVRFLDEFTVPAGTFERILETADTSPLDMGHVSVKFYAPGIGIVKDGAAELVEMTMPPCMPGVNTLCLNDGRFKVEVEWTSDGMVMNDASVSQVSNDSGEVWFFTPDNVEMLVKVLDACALEGYNNYWVFASGLTDRGVTLTVTDTKSGTPKEWSTQPMEPFEAILDTAAFQTCP